MYDKQDILIGIMIIFILIICVKMYLESDAYNLKCIISHVDGETYCVRERAMLNEAADLLALATNNMNQVFEASKEKYPNEDNVKRLIDGYNPKKICEVLPTSKYTAYSENKGEKLAFCLETEKNSGSLIDLNTLTYVALHEMAHICSESVGHTDEFWANFKFLIEEAKAVGVYTPVDYKKNPVAYCGISISDNPYFDL
jgi:hypothetical protein